MDTHIAVTIEGKTPLLLNRFTDEAQMEASSGTRSSISSNSDTPKEQATKCLYLDKDGKKPIIPGPNLFRGMIDAGKFFKVGRSKVTTQKTSLLPSCAGILEVTVPIQHQDPWEVDTRPVRIPATGGRILRHRPCFNDWKLAFTVELDTKEMSPKFMRDIVDKWGNAVGVGDFRPDCKGPFGKFFVTNWKVSKNGK
jgi:hypothetical protein